MTEIGQLAPDPAQTAERPARDDAATVRRAQLGSTRAFDELVRACGPDLYRYLLLRLRNESDARDALQETITDAWKGLATLRDADNYWPWLMTIAKRKATAIGRKRTTVTDLDPDLLPRADESALEVWDAIAQLRPIHREILVLRYVIGFSEKEAAQVLGIRVGAVKTRGFVARQALKELLT